MFRLRVRLRWLPLAVAGMLLAGAAPDADGVRHPPTSTDPTLVRSSTA